MISKSLKKLTKVLKKLKPLDFIFIGAILLVVAFYLYSKITRTQEWIHVTLRVEEGEIWWDGKQAPYWYVDDLKVGLEAYNSFGEKEAEVTDLTIFDKGGPGRFALIDLKLKGTFNQKKDLFLYQFQPLQIGRSLDLTLGKHQIEGLVTYIQDEPDYVWKTIKVKLEQVEPWVAQNYQAGLKQKTWGGQDIAEVLSVQIKPAQMVAYSDIRGQRIITTDPILKDVDLTLKVKGFASGNNHYFIDGAVLKIGDTIWFQFPEFSIRQAEITEIIE